MSAVTHLATELRNLASRNPGNLELAEVVDLYSHMVAAAYMIEHLTQELEKRELRPPFVLDGGGISSAIPPVAWPSKR